MSSPNMGGPITIYTDGACRGNPGPGGWGAVLIKGRKRKEICGGAIDSTNNQMELTAAIEALKALKKPCEVRLHSDSSYVVDGASRWLRGWKARGWRRAGGSRVANADLWQEIDQLLTVHDVEWVWVKGHAGNPGNERADQLASDGLDKIIGCEGFEAATGCLVGG
jgi:ribonuclease HI